MTASSQDRPGGAARAATTGEQGRTPPSAPRATPRPATSSRFDRIGAPGSVADRGHGQGRGSRHRDGLGKEALYSTSPSAAPTRPVEARCRRCDVPLALSAGNLIRLLVPPFLADPIRRRLWTRCPACDHFAWLDVRAGQPLRVWLERDTQR